MGKRKKGKEETVASDDVVEEINGGRAGGEPRNRVKRNEMKRKETKGNETKGRRMGTKMRDDRLQTTRSVNNTKADCGRG